MQKITLHIDGMHCGSCATGIQMLTESMDGVTSSSVDYEKKEGIFEFDENTVKKEEIMKGITDLGYSPKE